MPNAWLKYAASSPTVRPCRAGIGYMPTNDVKPGAMSAPSTISPPIGLGRSSTTNGMPRRAAAFIDSAIVDTYVHVRPPTSCRSYTRTSTFFSISGCRAAVLGHVERVDGHARLRVHFVADLHALGSGAADAVLGREQRHEREPLVSAILSIAETPALSIALWLVISPTRLPRRARGRFERNTSRPGSTVVVDCRAEMVRVRMQGLCRRRGGGRPLRAGGDEHEQADEDERRR